LERENKKRGEGGGLVRPEVLLSLKGKREKPF